ncbi:hypothetical protein MAR_011655 [Mya arenaria]|uniref:Uncharacterized protein n=1 Tax=Mya arenaria TaxID=6604 RepID=A0ABY7FYP8_MYAAR|nr:hypothetical protein MAR_011655 [Mya arenaria]
MVPSVYHVPEEMRGPARETGNAMVRVPERVQESASVTQAIKVTSAMNVRTITLRRARTTLTHRVRPAIPRVKLLAGRQDPRAVTNAKMAGKCLKRTGVKT